MAPLSKTTMGLRFMQRGENGHDPPPPAPAALKSKARYRATAAPPPPAPPQTASSTSMSAVPAILAAQGGDSKPRSHAKPGHRSGGVPHHSRGTPTVQDGGRLVVRKEASILAFPMLTASALASTSAHSDGPSVGRRSFGHFNTEIERLSNPIHVAAKTSRAAPTASPSDSDSEEHETDSSVDVADPVPARATAARRAQSARDPIVDHKGPFLKPRLGGFEGQPTAKRKKVG